MLAGAADGVLRESDAGQIIASSNKVTLNSSHGWKYTKLRVNSGLGITVLCLGDILISCVWCLRCKSEASLADCTRCICRSLKPKKAGILGFEVLRFQSIDANRHSEILLKLSSPDSSPPHPTWSLLWIFSLHTTAPKTLLTNRCLNSGGNVGALAAPEALCCEAPS